MSTNQLRPKYPSGIEANELSKFDKGIETDGILNTGLIEHGPDAKMTVPEDNTTTAAEIGGIRYNPDTDEFEGGFGDQSWRQLGGGGIRWVQADKSTPLHIAQTARGYLIDNRLMQSQIILPVVDRVGTIIAVADQFGQFAVRPLTIKASGRKIYGQTDDMTISTNNVSATFTWSGDEQGWIITSGIGLGQGQVYNRTIFSEVLNAPTAFIDVNHATEMVDVYVNGARLAETRYTLADTGVALKEEIPAGVEVQVIEYKPIQLTISDEDSRLKALEQQVQALKDGPIIWRYTAIGGETVLNPGTAFTRCKLEINGIDWDIDDYAVTDNKIVLSEPLAVDPVSGQGDRVKVTIGFDNEVGFEGYVSKQELKDEDGAKMVGTSLVSNLDEVISGKVLQWAVGAKVTSPHQIVQYQGDSYQYIGYLPHLLNGNGPDDDGGIWDSNNPAGTWVLISSDSGAINISNFVDITGLVAADSGLTKAINAAVATKKTIIFPSGGVIRLTTSNFVIPNDVKLVGMGGANACVINIDHEDTTNPQFVVSSRNVVSGIDFYYPKQTYDTDLKPIVAYKPLFFGAGFACLFEYLNIGNAYYGFSLGGTDQGSSSKVTIHHIYGAPLARGLSLDRCLDIPRISDIHWNYNQYMTGPTAYAQNLKQWIFDNGVGFHFGRVDFAAAFRLFCFGYQTGYFFRSERYTGSSDSFRLVQCDADICSRPIFAQNYSGTLHIEGGKFTGGADGTNGLVETALSTCLFYQTSPVSKVVISNAQFNSLSADAISFGSDMRVTNCDFKKIGKAGTQRAVFRARSGANCDLHLDGVQIELYLDNSRGVWSDDSTGTFTASNGTSITGVGLEGYRWTAGKVAVDNTCYIPIQSRNNMSWVKGAVSSYTSETVPTSGSYYIKGDFVRNTTLSPTALVSSANYVVFGWVRLTTPNVAGTNHVLGTDWLEVKTFTESLPKIRPAGTTLGRPANPALYSEYFDTDLGKPIIVKSIGPVVWVDFNGTVV